MKNQFEKLSNATIMMVDDEPITMELLQTFLEEVGYSNFCLEEKSENAIESLERVVPDILLLDLIMPKVSGFEILTIVRNHPQFKHLPIIILTSSSDTESKLRALELGATDFLSKPVDKSELLLRVRNTLKAKAYSDRRAYYDPLTKLPNKLRFQKEFDWTLKKAKQYHSQLALLDISIDDFGRVNTSVGLRGGDSVLVELARRIEHLFKATDQDAHKRINSNIHCSAYRSDGGAFLLLLENIKDNVSIAAIGQQVLETVRKPVLVDGYEIHLTASVGISSYPEENTDCTSLQRLANSAREFAKKAGGNVLQFSSKDISSIYEKRFNMETKLRKALDKNEFVIHYQPKVDLHTGAVHGVEALLRWNSDGPGLVPPNEFIPLAEETGLIVPIGNWVLSEACRQLVSWRKRGCLPLEMNVNLSVLQFQDKHFFANIKRTIDKIGINPCLLTLEFTESLLMDNIEDKIKKLEELKNLGVKLSIDDFGTGYSSLNYLRKLPVDELKIDRSFVMNIPKDSNSMAIISSIIYLAKKLGVRTVAEGVETKEQRQYLEDEQCHQFQGFLLSRPLPGDKLYDRYLRLDKNRYDSLATNLESL